MSSRDQLAREISVRAHRLIETSGRGSSIDSEMRWTHLSLQDRIEGQTLLINDLYIIMYDGGLEVEWMSSCRPIYVENHHLQTTFIGDKADLLRAVEIMRQRMILDDLSRV